MDFKVLIPITQRLALLAGAARANNPDGKGRVEIVKCAMCGHLSVASVNNDGSDVVVLSEIAKPTDCPRCLTVFQRAPEVYDWALAVIAETLSHVNAKIESSRAPAPPGGDNGESGKTA